MTSSKWIAPQNFVSMANTLCCGDTDEIDDTESELWLVKVPQGFDISTLNKLDASVFGVSGGTQTLKVKTEQEKKTYYSVAAFKEPADCQTMSTVMANARGQTVLGGGVSNMLVVTEAAAHRAWHAAGALLAPRKPVPMPSGLRPRFTPFGAGTPCPRVSGKIKKRKKRASKGEESMEEECQEVKRSSKKRKREAQLEESMQEEVRQSSKKIKREASPDSCVDPSPKKRSKQRKSMDVDNGHAGNTASFTESPASKKREAQLEESMQEEVRQSSKKIKREASPDSCVDPSPKKRSKQRKSMDVDNGHAGNTASFTESPASKKREAQLEESMQEEVRQSSKKIKREASPDSCVDPSPKKRSKQRKSMDVDNGHAGNTASFTESPASKKKKSRKSAGGSQDSSAAGGDLFVLDVTGDQRPVNDELPVADSHSHSKHKKSKKRTMM